MVPVIYGSRWHGLPRMPAVLTQLTGDICTEVITRLKPLRDNLSCGIQPLYKQNSGPCESGGVQFIGLGVNHCVDARVLNDLSLLKHNRYNCDIGVRLNEQ